MTLVPRRRRERSDRSPRNAARAVLVAFLLVAASASTRSVAHAQYSFAIPRATMECFIRPDASVRIRYEIEFQNYGQTIDVVDIGLPHEDYNISNMTAALDGRPIPAISRSTYIDVGVEVNLGIGTGIPSGERGTFTFEATMPNLVFSDTTNDELASFRITPTWFDGNLLSGSTDIRVAIHLPPGVRAEEVLHQGTPFYNKADTEDHALVGFRFEGERMDGPHMVGISFPRASMTRVVEITKLDLLHMWWEGSPDVRVIAAAVFFLAFVFFFLRFTGNTGFTVLLFCLGGLGALFFFEPLAQLYGMPVMIVLFVLVHLRVERRKRAYLPPLVSVEGGGIKRGLTAPEAAVLLEMPLGKVVTLVVFGMIKKELVKIVSHDPLKLAVDDAMPKDHGQRRKLAASWGTVIHGYEHAFIDAVRANQGLAIEHAELGAAIGGLVDHVVERMLGFDVEETKKYYRAIVQRAWIDAEAIGEIDARTKAIDKNLEWMVMDADYDDRFERWGTGGYVYRPIWIRTTPASSTVGAGVGLPSVGGGGGSDPLKHVSTSLGDVAGSFAGWTENVSGSLASAIAPGSVSVEGPKGVMDLSGVDKVTGQVLEAFFTSSGGGGGGGGGGGCACACAGCACACACAGGGR